MRKLLSWRLFLVAARAHETFSERRTKKKGYFPIIHQHLTPPFVIFAFTVLRISIKSCGLSSQRDGLHLSAWPSRISSRINPSVTLIFFSFLFFGFPLHACISAFVRSASSETTLLLVLSYEERPSRTHSVAWVRSAAPPLGGVPKAPKAFPPPCRLPVRLSLVALFYRVNSVRKPSNSSTILLDPLFFLVGFLFFLKLTGRLTHCHPCEVERASRCCEGGRGGAFSSHSLLPSCTLLSVGVHFSRAIVLGPPCYRSRRYGQT